MRILIAEDDEKLNQIICTYLNRNSYQVCGCRNPAETYDNACTRKEKRCGKPVRLSVPVDLRLRFPCRIEHGHGRRRSGCF